MRKLSKLLIVLIVVSVVASLFVACEKSCDHKFVKGVCTKCGEKDPNYIDLSSRWIDYVAQLEFDLNSNTKKFEVVKVHQYIDGDTTHFDVPSNYEEQFANGVFKARYLAVNTPESTGDIQDYGFTASRYTHDKLASAVSIYVESDSDKWDIDSTASRVTAWVWYKPDDNSPYRNLNLELLQYGYGVGSNAAGNRYGEICSAALAQAIAHKLICHSGELDPEIYRGDLLDVTPKDLRLNPNYYDAKKVAVRGVVTVVSEQSAYIESVDEESGIAYGVQIYMGFNAPTQVVSALKPGNYVLVTGTFKLSDYGFPPQISGIIHNVRKPNDPDNTRIIESASDTNVKASYKEITVNEFFGNTQITYNALSGTADPAQVTKTFATAELMRDATVCIKNIVVKKVYTTDNGGNNDGAISITGEVNGEEITVRTTVMYENGNPVTEDVFKNKTIDVRGIVDFYTDRNVYQVKIFSLADVNFHE